MTTALFAYANPIKGEPLRFDWEQSVVDHLRREFTHVDFDTQHAATTDDIRRLVSTRRFDVLHFSGHGAHGLALHSGDRSGPEILAAKDLVQLILLAPVPPTLLVLLACYSSSAASELGEAAPFVITVDCEIHDTDCELFVREFYDSYFRSNQITPSFTRAQLALKSHCRASVHLERRAATQREGHTIIECIPPQKDPIIVNLDRVIDAIHSLGVAHEEVLHRLRRKIRIHQQIFDYPRDRATIPIGHPFFGEFSWTNGKEVVYCNQIFRLADNLPSDHVEAWASLLVAYNDVAWNPIRFIPNPASPANAPELTRSVNRFSRQISSTVDHHVEAIQQYGGPAATAAVAMLREYLALAKAALESQEYSRAHQNLEFAVTSFHEVVVGMQPQEAR